MSMHGIYQQKVCIPQNIKNFGGLFWQQLQNVSRQPNSIEI